MYSGSKRVERGQDKLSTLSSVQDTTCIVGSLAANPCQVTFCTLDGGDWGIRVNDAYMTTIFSERGMVSVSFNTK